MFLDIFTTFVINILILLSLSLIHSMVPFSSNSKHIIRKILFGLYIGITGISLMTIPFDFNNGVFFDTRSILVSSSGIFLGFIPTLIGAGSLIIYRIVLGGAGTLAGVLEIVIAAVIGLLYRYYRKTHIKSNTYKIKELFIVAVITQVLIFTLMFTLPEEIRKEVLPKMWIIILFVLPTFSVLIYKFHIHQVQTLQQKNKLKQSEIQYRNLFEESHVVLMLLDKDGKIIDANKTCLEFYGWSFKEITEKYIYDINILSKEDVIKEIENCLKRNKAYFNFTHKTAYGTMVDVEIYSGPILINGTQYLLSTIIDVTKKIKTNIKLLQEQDKLTYSSNHDYLTGLYNRYYFEQALQELNTKASLPLSIILGDVNNLKVINDTYSHLVGDELLKEIADILQITVRQSDIIARWGGDEFALLLPNTDKKTVEKICKRIEKLCLKSSFEHTIPSISLGYDTKVVLDEDIHNSLKLAEKRMYRYKRKSKLK